jgi:hypothetical protein
MIGVVTAEAITSALIKLDAAAAQTDAAVTACSKIDPQQRAAWQSWYAGYQKFSTANQNHGYFALGLAEIGDEVVAYSDELAQWHAQLEPICGNMSPYVSESEAAQPGSVTDVVTKVTWLAGILLAGYVVVTYLPRPRRRR